MGIYEIRKERKQHALDQESDKENDQEKREFIMKNQFYFQPFMIISVICRVDQIEFI